MKMPSLPKFTNTEWLLIGLGALYLFSGDSEAMPQELNENPIEGQILTKSKAFDDKVIAIARELETDPNYIFLHLFSESGLDPTAHVDYRNKKWIGGLVGPINSSTKGGGLFGLMRQFAKPPITDNFDSFMQQTDLEQLDAFLRLYGKYKGRIKEFADMRMLGFSPKFVDSSDDTVMYIDNPDKETDAYSANAHLDLNGDKKITVGECKSRWRKFWNSFVAKRRKKGAPIQVKTRSGK